MINKEELINKGRIEEGINNIYSLANQFGMDIDKAVELLSPSDVVLEALKSMEQSKDFHKKESATEHPCVVTEITGGLCIYGNYVISCTECAYLSRESLTPEEIEDLNNFNFEDIVNYTEKHDNCIPF